MYAGSSNLLNKSVNDVWHVQDAAMFVNLGRSTQNHPTSLTLVSVGPVITDRRWLRRTR